MAAKRGINLLLRRFVKTIIEYDEDFEGKRDTTFEEYCCLCGMSGVKVSFDDDAFLAFFVGKCHQEWGNEEYENCFRTALEKYKILDPTKNDVHFGILREIVPTYVVGNREFYKLVADYCIRNFKETEVGQLAVRFAKTFGVTSCDWEEIYGKKLFDSLRKTEAKDGRGTD